MALACGTLTYDYYMQMCVWLNLAAIVALIDAEADCLVQESGDKIFVYYISLDTETIFIH